MIELPKIVVELVNPQAAAPGVWDFVKDYVYPLLPTLIGSGILGTIFWKRRKKQEEKIKAEVQKEIETHRAELQKTASNLSQTLAEKISRRGRAHELRIKKEYEFYEKYGIFSNNIISATHKAIGIIRKINISPDNNIDNEIVDVINLYENSSNDLQSLYVGYLCYIDDNISDALHKLILDAYDYFANFNKLIKLSKTEPINTADELKKDFQPKLARSTALVHILIIDKIRNDAKV